ncbi:MAG: RNA chaperone Hfq [Nitrospirota bacterium]
MEGNLLDTILHTHLENKTTVAITLHNKIRLTGTVKAFDSYILILESQKMELVYRHAISSITALDQVPVITVREPAIKKAVPPPSPVTRRKSEPSAAVLLSPFRENRSINSSMKDGLLKWMQEQKAAK